ncbi:MAG: hypothetical protein LC746_02535 [Acidobacteria bacterium]|nr:hypothetical protein [Acidobacteriota bacterium]
MDAKLILILAVAAAFAVALLVVLARARGRGGQMLERSTAAAATPPRTSSGGEAVTHKRISVKFGGELLEMLSSGRREEVLRLVRERAGIGEAEAEAVVARLESLMGRSKQ